MTMVNDSKAIKFNSRFGLVNKLVVTLIQFATRVVLVYFLGSFVLGISGLFTNVVSIFGLADLGLNTAIVYMYYEPLAKNNIEELKKLTNLFQKIYYLIFFVVVLLGLIMMPFIQSIVNEPNSKFSIFEIQMYFILTVLNVAFSYLMVYKTSLLFADNRAYVTYNVNSVVQIIFFLLQILGLLFWKSYAIFLITIILMNLTSNLISSIFAEKRYPWLRDRRTTKVSFSSDIQPILKTTFSAVVYKISGILLNSTDNIIISVVISTTVVGVYTNYLLISNALILLITVLFSAYTPSIGKLVAKKEDKQNLESVFYNLQKKANIISIVAVTMFAVGANLFIQIWMGNNFQLNTFTVLMLSINLYLATGFQPVWVFREATALYKILRWRMLWAAIINIPLSVVLAKILGVGGVVLGSILARLITYYLFEPVLITRKILNAKSSKYFFTLLINFTVTIILASGMQYLTSLYLINFNVIVQLIVSWFVTFVVDYIVIYFIYGNPIKILTD